MSEDQEKLVEVVNVTLTKAELKFIRDMFGILLPPDGQKTVSESLAEMTGRKILEKRLWQKVYNACVDSKVAVGDTVPDYIVVTTSQPEMAIGMLQHDTSDEEGAEHAEAGLSKLFEDGDKPEEEPEEDENDE